MERKRKKKKKESFSEVNHSSLAFPCLGGFLGFVSLFLLSTIFSVTQDKTHMYSQRNADARKEHAVFHLWRAIEHLTQLFRSGLTPEYYDDFSAVITSAWFTSWVCCFNGNPCKKKFK